MTVPAPFQLLTVPAPSLPIPSASLPCVPPVPAPSCLVLLLLVCPLLVTCSVPAPVPSLALPTPTAPPFSSSLNNQYTFLPLFHRAHLIRGGALRGSGQRLLSEARSSTTCDTGDCQCADLILVATCRQRQVTLRILIRLRAVAGSLHRRGDHSARLHTRQLWTLLHQANRARPLHCAGLNGRQWQSGG